MNVKYVVCTIFLLNLNKSASQTWCNDWTPHYMSYDVQYTNYHASVSNLVSRSGHL